MLETILEFAKQHMLACGVAILVVIVIIIAIIVGIVRAVKKKRSKISYFSDTNLPTDPYREESATVETSAEPKGKALFSWVKDGESTPQPEKAVDVTKGEQLSMTMEPSENAQKTRPVSENTAETKTNPSPAQTKDNPIEQTNKPAQSMAKAVKATSAKQQAETPIKKELEKNADATQVKRLMGKWVVKEKGEGEFVAYLYANNGEVILTSEIYSSEDGAKKGILTIQKNVRNATFQIYRDKNKNFYYKLKTLTNRFLCVGESYPSRASCLKAIESVKRFSESDIVDEVEKDITVIKYEPTELSDEPVKNGYSGKWIINTVDDMYMAQLFASNGELLISSESYSSATSAKSAIDTIRTNGLAGNFIIDSDKKGRYFFKLRNVQKSTLCMGESYAQLSSCYSAIESVRRFLKTAKLVETQPQQDDDKSAQ